MSTEKRTDGKRAVGWSLPIGTWSPVGPGPVVGVEASHSPEIVRVWTLEPLGGGATMPRAAKVFRNDEPLADGEHVGLLPHRDLSGNAIGTLHVVRQWDS